MDNPSYRTYRYRFAVLGVVMLVNLTIQALWISYAPVAGAAAAFYGVSELKIGLFAMVFMIAFIPLSLPVSWLIDRFGFAKMVGLGAVATAAFGIMRGLAGSNYAMAFAATLGLAAAQPFLLNAWTKVPAAWCPARERATAVGLFTLSNIVGTALGLVLTPILAEGMSLPRIQLAYGLAAGISALAFVLVAREKPALPPDDSAAGVKALETKGFAHALSLPSFRRYLAMAFIGMGVFNGVTTWVEAIVRPRGLDSTQAGLVMAIMLVGGVAGALIMPALSDRSGRRRPFMAIGLGAAVPGLLGLAFAPGFIPIALSCVLLGFALVSVNPIGMQYASEVALPTPEGSTNGLVSLAGQASVALVWGMEAVNAATGSFSVSLSLGAALLAGSALLALGLKEPGVKGPGRA